MKHRRFNGWWLIAILPLVVVLRNLPQKIIYRQRATSIECQIHLNTNTLGKLNRSWVNYAQGGEENELMLQPVFEQILALKPGLIRIDHIFDFPNLDSRLLEIKRLGAIPFISLSYFPQSISDELTRMPISLQEWTQLITKEAEKINSYFEGETIYYEVWNEPDLFGNFSADDYYKLYQATLDGLKFCSNCKYKIGGPAITTMKPDWMDQFLNLILKNNTRLDFISWHSYQKNPTKTVEEWKKLLSLSGYKGLTIQPELMITEWAITPEISYLNDGLESASHTIASVSLMNNIIDKMFAFEFKDGVDPSGKQFWGRWGLITHQKYGIQLKPRYYAFSYLNQLGNYRITTESPQDNNYFMASMDYPSNITVVATNSNPSCQTIELSIDTVPNGAYDLSVFFLDNQHDPSQPQKETLTVNNRKVKYRIPTVNNGVYLVKIERYSAGIFSGQGISGKANDFSARLSDNSPPIDFPILDRFPPTLVDLSFWFKETGFTYTEKVNFSQILASDAEYGFRLGIERNNKNKYLVLVKTLPQYQEERHQFDLEGVDLTKWNNYRVAFDNSSNTVSLGVGDKVVTSIYDRGWPIETGTKIYFGSSNETVAVNGYLDDLTLGLDSNRMSDNFNVIP